MNYYVIQVMTKEENKYLALAKKLLEAHELTQEAGSLIWPRRKLIIKRKGNKIPSLAPIFPGYIFLETKNLLPDVYWVLKYTSGFIRFLKSNQNIEPLCGEDEKLVLHFLNYGQIVEQSKVYFDENNTIKVVSGPMKDMEGRIVKVDRRKKRIKVRLFLYDNPFLVDFGYELVEPVEGVTKSQYLQKPDNV